MPVGAGVDVRDGRHRRVLLVDADLQADPLLGLQRAEVVEHLEAVLLGEPVDGADVGEVVEADLIVEELHHVREAGGLDEDRRLARVADRLQDGVAERFVQGGEHLGDDPGRLGVRVLSLEPLHLARQRVARREVELQRLDLLAGVDERRVVRAAHQRVGDGHEGDRRLRRRLGSLLGGVGHEVWGVGRGSWEEAHARRATRYAGTVAGTGRPAASSIWPSMSWFGASVKRTSLATDSVTRIFSWMSISAWMMASGRGGQPGM